MTRWFKWYGPQWLQSTARDELTDYERGNWLDFCALASMETIGVPSGSFKVASWEALARKLNSPLDHIISTRDKCLATQRINITESPEGIFVSIINWQRYQTASNNVSASTLPAQAPKSASRISIQSRVEKNRVEEKREEEKASSLRSDALAAATSRKRNTSRYRSFEDVRADAALMSQLRTRFPTVDLTYELDKCEEWWRSNGKTVKSPKLASQNWLEKATQIAANVMPPKGEQHGIPGNRPAGAFDDIE